MTSKATQAVPPVNSNKGRKKKRTAHSKDDNDIKCDPPLDSKDLCELQDDPRAFETFANHFLQPTFSKKWNNKLKHSTKKIQVIGDILTVTDKAFVLLVLENNWERWIDINNQSNNHFQMSKRGRSKPTQSKMKTKCTHLNVKETGTKIDNIEKENAEVWKGWNNAGISCHNELCLLVKNNASKCKDVDKAALENMQSIVSSQKCARKRARTTTESIKPFVEEEESCGDDEDSSDLEKESSSEESDKESDN